MFERFTKPAREVVKEARRHAEEHGGEVRPAHLLLAMLARPDCLAVRVLEECGASPAEVRAELDRRHGRYGDGLDEDDAEALATIGIDLSEVVARIESNLGGLRRPRTRGFSRSSKKALELALREALALRHNYIGTEHILLGLARVDDRVVDETLARFDLTLGGLRRATTELLRRAG